MLFHVLICIALLAVVFAEIPSTPKVTNSNSIVISREMLLSNTSLRQVSATIKDTTVNGIEGFNFNIVAPFKFQDYVFGVRYALGNFNKLPESIFAKKSFETPADGLATVNADYDFVDNSLNIATRWNSDSLGLTVQANGDSKRKLKTFGVSKSLNIKDNRLSVAGAYDLIKKKISGSASFDADKTRVQLSVDSESRNPELFVSRALDENNEINPAIKLRTGEVSYGYRRKWHGGSLLSRFFPGDKATLEWKDNGASGAWTTLAEIPLADATATKVTFSREWEY
jgi:hypothetical protein